MVQEARKTAGLEVSDRIRLGLEATGELADAVEEHREQIAAETLAVDVTTGAISDGIHGEDAVIDGMRLAVSLARS